MDCANKFDMKIHTDERLRERKIGKNAGDFLERRWKDFTFCEEDGESLEEVQMRNIKALEDILARNPKMNIVIGTHGTALSTILNYYDSSYNCDGFRSIWLCMPYIIRCDFDDKHALIQKEELLSIKRGY